MSSSESHIPLSQALAQETERGENMQVKALGLEQFDFKGKSICEIGTGSREQLARYMHERMRKDDTLTLVNPMYAETVDEEGRLVRRDAPGDVSPAFHRFQQALNVQRIAGRFPEITLQKNHYDLIVGSKSVPQHLKPEDLPAFFAGIVESLKHAGKGIFVSDKQNIPLSYLGVHDEEGYTANLEKIVLTMFDDTEIHEYRLTIEKHV